MGSLNLAIQEMNPEFSNKLKKICEEAMPKITKPIFRNQTQVLTNSKQFMGALNLAIHISPQFVISYFCIRTQYGQQTLYNTYPHHPKGLYQIFNPAGNKQQVRSKNYRIRSHNHPKGPLNLSMCILCIIAVPPDHIIFSITSLYVAFSVSLMIKSWLGYFIADISLNKHVKSK